MDRRFSRPTLVTIAGLAVVAVGIVVQIASGVEYPLVPPGAVIAVVVAGFVALAHRWWWPPLVATAYAAFLTFGSIVTPGVADRLGNPADVGQFLGTAIQMVGVLATLVAGVVAAFQSRRSAKPRQKTGSAARP